jgi:hypothetical protein
MADYDVQLKFIIIGDAGVGKSSLLHRFIDNRCAFRRRGAVWSGTAGVPALRSVLRCRPNARSCAAGAKT